MRNIPEKADKIDDTGNPFSLEHTEAYEAWRAQKLDNYPDDSQKIVVEISDMANLTLPEMEAMKKVLRKTNMVIYACKNPVSEPKTILHDLNAFAAQFGLDCTEAHRSAGEENIVAIEVSNKGSKRGYIPYSTRPLNWHTEGYYNPPKEAIGSFILHCTRNAADGGRNQLLDPEIVYIRLRDENPAYIRALSHPEAMTIPFNEEPDGTIRPDSIGPVFKQLSDGSGITMRYTARTRSISWRDDDLTREAVAYISHLLDGNEPLIMSAKMEPGQGVINNNVLHNRTGFTDSGEAEQSRLLYRIRFHQRVKMDQV